MTFIKIDPRSVTLTSFNGSSKTIAEWAEANGLGEIVEVHGDWAVTSHGLEHLTIPPYFIPTGFGRARAIAPGARAWRRRNG
jgi:hypothetical protein